jgi:murein DD-endopeptidase MepM/ murein hydrolase activator NlpD
MRVIRRLISVSLALFVLMALLLGSGELAQARNDEPQITFVAHSDEISTDLSSFNLGDCLRERDSRNWPAAYALICADLNAAEEMESRNAPHETNQTFSPTKSAPPELRSAKPSPAAAMQGVPMPKKPVETKSASLAIAVPMPRPRPARTNLAARNLAPPATTLTVPAPSVRIAGAIKAPKTEPVQLAPSSPRCLIDEKGATILNAPARALPPHVVSQRSKGRSAGVALLVPAACGVKSPMKAKVLFAGEFKGYRGVVILALPAKRRLIIAGLDALRVKRGDVVERGAIIGSTLPTGAPALAAAFNEETANDRSLVYFDLRNAKGSGEDIFWLADAS